MVPRPRRDASGAAGGPRPVAGTARRGRLHGLREAVGCTAFEKSAGRNWLVAHHQDRTLPIADGPGAAAWPGASRKEGQTFITPSDAVLEACLAVRLHLDDSTGENGPLRVIPGSHRRGTLTAERVAALADGRREAVLTVPRGGVIVMRPLLLHASSKAVSDAPRRVLHFVFAPPAGPVDPAWAYAV